MRLTPPPARAPNRTRPTPRTPRPRAPQPDNVGVTASGTVKLLDLGYAVVVERAKRGGEGGGELDGTYALTGETGSPRYMPPEACVCEELGASG